MKIIISSESTIDLPQEVLDKYNIKTTAFGINFDGELQLDTFGISDKIFDYVDKTKNLPKTSAIPPEQYKEHFESLLKDYDAVIHISISSNLSSAYNNAKLIADEMENVFVIDSRNLSTGIALVAIKGCELIKEKKDAKEIAEELQEYTSQVRSSFIIEKLNYLYKGGRCSALTLLGANIMKIKPQIVVKDGRMSVGKKYIGSLNKVITKYCDELLAEYPKANLDRVFITRSSPMTEVVELLKTKLQEKGFQEVYDTYAGGTISSHCGPNTLGILFVENK